MNKNIILLFSILVVFLLLFVLSDSDDIEVSSIPRETIPKATSKVQETKINYIENHNDKISTNKQSDETILPPSVPIDPTIISRRRSSNGKFEVSIENPDLIDFDKNGKQIPLNIMIGNSGFRLMLPSALLKHSSDINLKIIDRENNITNTSPAYFLDEISDNSTLDHFIKINSLNTSDVTYTSKPNKFN